MKASAEEMRLAGYEAVDRVVAHCETLEGKAAWNGARRAGLEKLEFGIAAGPRPAAEVIAQVEREILHYMARPAHPRFFAFVPGPGNFIGAVADFLSQGYNVFAGNWFAASGPAMVELRTIQWLAGLVGFPRTAGGLFLSGGSLANFTALAVARDRILGEERLGEGVAYYSDQTHSSVEKALRLLGFARRQLRKLPSGHDFRLPAALLRSAMEEDRRGGRHPCCVIANAGTTNTGAVDPLGELAAVCRAEGAWLHVDGAYGAAAAICEEGRRLLAGIEEADSLTFDPHKWLFQPFDCGCVLLRDGSLLPRTFYSRPEYLKDVGDNAEEPNLLDYGPELTRPFRALKLWMTLQVFGEDAMRKAVEHGLEMARYAESLVRAHKDWVIATPAQMGMLSFRYEPAGIPRKRLNECNREIGKRITASGFAVVLSTELKGRTVLRMCPINPRTTEADVRDTIRELDRVARE
ncbi:MAG: aminotransferase class I/II-fold pyridoxal phosphate-dependent enzyme [Bryobacterales bacterium]|nr:aminotransferase class I/II-fold pyridoxal phosphate-dependent enzyme [Bryobacterales bacterium]